MRMSTPRVPPLTEQEWSEEVKSLLEPIRDRKKGTVLNIFATLARHPDAFRRWMVFANHVMIKSTLPPREREILILRIGWLCRAGYEWGQHAQIALLCGMSEDDVRRVADGPDAEGWTDAERALLRAVDELHGDAFISDSTWAELSRTWDEKQLVDLVFTVGQYNLVSMMLNTLGVQLDPGIDGFHREP